MTIAGYPPAPLPPRPADKPRIKSRPPARSPISPTPPPAGTRSRFPAFQSPGRGRGVVVVVVVVVVPSTKQSLALSIFFELRRSMLPLLNQCQVVTIDTIDTYARVGWPASKPVS